LERFIESRLVMGASPTGTRNALENDESLKGEGAVSNKDKFSSDQSHEIPELFKNITQHIPLWDAMVKSHEDIEVKRLNGNSNAIFKV